MALTSNETEVAPTAVDYMEIYGTDNPVFVEDAEFMELYGTDNPEFVAGD